MHGASFAAPGRHREPFGGAARAHGLLWETHISIREHSNTFAERLLGMVSGAAGLFGRDSGGLKHLDLPAGKVLVGDVKSLGVVPAP